MLMSQRQALETLARHRGDRIVVTTMTAVGIWPELSDTPLDFAYLPSSMGQAPALGLGLALGTGRGVIVVNGDGSMLMNLGVLVTLAAHPADVYLLILDNGLYEVTGGQATAGTGRADFGGLARAAGIGRVYECRNLPAWEATAPTALAGPGPVVVVIKTEGRTGQKTPAAPRPMAEQIARLRSILGAKP
jgi:thiamine pyrophosphate-dependent acetolactate synthase large subunit-like protein